MVKENIIYTAKIDSVGRDGIGRKSDLILVGDILEGAEMLKKFDKRQIQLYVRGYATKRHKRTEVLLPKLVEQKRLRAFPDPTYKGKGHKLVYSLYRKGKDDELAQYDHIEHDKTAAECFLRFYLPVRGQEGVEVFPQPYFKGFDCMPDFCIKFPTGTPLPGEYSSKHDFIYTGKIRGKIKAYRKSHKKFLEAFGTSPQIVFIINIDRQILKRFVARYTSDVTENMNFCDYSTFIREENVIDSPIWIVNTGEEKSLND